MQSILSSKLCNILQVLYMSMDTYLQGLFVLSNDPSAEVRKLVNISTLVCKCGIYFTSLFDTLAFIPVLTYIQKGFQ